MRFVLLLALLLAGCTEPRSAACKQVCNREAKCIDETDSKIPFDEKECIAACAALEQDESTSAAKVKRHVDCVQKQSSCAAVLECK